MPAGGISGVTEECFQNGHMKFAVEEVPSGEAEFDRTGGHHQGEELQPALVVD